MKKKKEVLIQKRQKLLKEIERHGDFIKANVRRITKVGIPTFGYHLTYKDENQKTHSKYVSQKNIKQVEKGVENMRIVKKLINTISELNIEIAVLD